MEQQIYYIPIQYKAALLPNIAPLSRSHFLTNPRWHTHTNPLSAGYLDTKGRDSILSQHCIRRSCTPPETVLNQQNNKQQSLSSEDVITDCVRTCVIVAERPRNTKPCWKNTKRCGINSILVLDSDMCPKILHWSFNRFQWVRWYWLISLWTTTALMTCEKTQGLLTVSCWITLWFFPSLSCIQSEHVCSERPPELLNL